VNSALPQEQELQPARDGLAGSELRLQSVQLQALLDHMPQGITVFDEQLRLQWWNRRFTEVLNFPPESVCRGARFEDFIRINAMRGEYGPGDVEEQVHTRTALARQFKPHSFDRTSLDGRTLLIQGLPLYHDGRISGFISTYTDITERKQTEEELRRKHAILETVLANIPGGVSLVDGKLQLITCNEQYKQILDLPEELFQPAMPALESIIRYNALRGEYGPGDVEKQLAAVTKMVRGCTTHTWERTRPNGTVIEIRGTPMPDGGLVTIYTDITVRKRAEERLRLTEKVFENSPGAIVICDRKGGIMSVNPAFSEITGYARDEVVGLHPKLLLSEELSETLYADMWRSLKENGRWSGDIWGVRKNGEVYPKWLTINAVPDENAGGYSHYIGIFSDVTTRKEAEERIYRLAHHDALTGLPNRYTLEARLAHSLHEAQQYDSRVAIMFVDLDHFKTINDSLGHAVGDRMLIEVARRLTATVRESDTVARLGGDEFVIVMPDFDSTTDISIAANRIVESFADPLHIGDHEFHTSVSIGISVFPDDGDSVEAVMRSADTAMYHAKALGRNNFQYFAPAMNLAANERLDLGNRLRHALARQEFELYYQPQYDTASLRIIGVEALLRWRPGGGDMVPPSRFIPVAEETGMIANIGTWVLQESCRQLREWLDRGMPPIRMAVNVSARQLRQKCFSDSVAAALAGTGLPPELLELEITESTVMEHPQEAIRVLQSLRDMGVTLAIDDFGTGYSSLSYLKMLPINRLKIDRSFVTDIDKDANDATIARATVALAHSLGLQVTAEGVETESQLDMLRTQGCDEVQGYHLSRPVTAERIPQLLPASVISLADWINRPR
jgi:diguanylate cyclase (GGDEF)-like protein/PAS domain S-box-containing protein